MSVDRGLWPRKIILAVLAAVGTVAAGAILIPDETLALPPGFADTAIGSGWDQAVGLCFAADGRMFVWEKGGRIWNVENGVKAATPLLDIHEEVGNWEDYGFTGVALDPDFYNNGYIYVMYVVDYHYLKYFGTPNYDPDFDEPYHDTIGRVVRYTCNAGDGYRSVNYNSRLVLIGESITTGIPICSVTHGVGTLMFGVDGSLLVSCGDGASPYGVDGGGNVPGSSNTALADGILNQTLNVGAFRSQLVNALNGKVLRINPANGDGLPSNPFYNAAAPRSARSRVYAMGFRNPYRFTIRPGTGDPNPANANPGTLYVGDVGWFSWEELNVCTAAAQNFGWPVYEGFDPTVEYSTTHVQNRDAPNPLFGQGGCNRQFFYFDELIIPDSLNPPSWPNPCNANQQIPSSLYRFRVRRPRIDWFHNSGPARCGAYAGNDAVVFDVGAPGAPVSGPQFPGNCSVGGVWYTGTNFPPQYQNTYFHADYGARWIRQFVFNAQNEPVEEHEFGGEEVGAVVGMGLDPISGALCYINYDFQGNASVRQIRWLDDLPPVAVASANPTYGPAPLTVQFTGSNSTDPEEETLSYLWDFGDGSPPSTQADPSHTYGLEEDITAQGTIVARVFSLNPGQPIGAGNTDPEIIRDNDLPPVGTEDSQRQYDTYHAGDQGNNDWIGYTFASSRQFRRILFQEGMDFGDGGFFQTLNVQVLNGSTWSNVSGVTLMPTYPGGNGVNFETFAINFPAVSGTGIRLQGNPGGSEDYISVGELRVYAALAAPITAPTRYDVTLRVTDPEQAFSVAQFIVSMNNTPPQVSITSPVNGMLYAADCALGHPQTAAFAARCAHPDGDAGNAQPDVQLMSITGDGEPAPAGAAPRDGQLTIPLTADITDAEHSAGQITCKWQTIFHHNTHTHPGPVSNNCSGSAVVTPVGCDGEVYYYEFKLTATDAAGLSTSQSVYAYPDCFGDFDFSLNTDDADLAEWRLCYTGPSRARSQRGGCGPNCTCESGECAVCGPGCTCSSAAGGGLPGGTPDTCLDADTDADTDIDCADWPAFLAAYQCSTHHLPLMAITEFVNALLGTPTNPPDLCIADLNGDGKADGDDIDAFVQALILG